MEDSMFIISSDSTGKSNYAMLKHLATAEALADREAAERGSEYEEDVIAVGAGSVGSGLLSEGYKMITDVPSTSADRSRQSFRDVVSGTRKK